MLSLFSASLCYSGKLAHFRNGIRFFSRKMHQHSLPTQIRRILPRMTFINKNLFSTVQSVPISITDVKNMSSTDIFNVELPTNANNPHLLALRHSTSHVLAMAVQRLYPDIQVTIGPWIEDG